MRYFFIFLTVILLSLPTHSSSYIGAGHSINSSANVDNQSDGLRIDWGATINSNLDLEWSLVDFGASSYGRPTYVEPIPEDNEKDNYENIGFGSLSRASDSIVYRGTDSLHARGVSAGLKFKMNANEWLQLYARASLFLWQAETKDIELSEGREEISIAGTVTNSNLCGNVTQCLIAGKTVDAVDFWYGYGLTAKPLDWLAIRVEYSIISLSAVNFPSATLEGISTGLELHF